MMSHTFLKTDLEGKINNLPHFKSEALLPVFEAIVNSIHAIEDRKSLTRGEITVRIIREKGVQSTFEEKCDDKKEERKIVNFDIEDNGVGFDDKNYESFCTAESTYKMHKGGKGVGRFFWLKAFEKVEIKSVFESESATNSDKKLEKKERRIRFTKKNGIDELFNGAIDPKTPQKTIVNLSGFKEEYRKQSSAYKTTQKIAQRILEHCLSYYIGNIAPTIIVKDDEETYFLDDEFKNIQPNITTEPVEISGLEFSISHIKLYQTYNRMHNIVLCADHRDVKAYQIQQYLGTSAQFDDENEKFIYVAYVSSPYLNSHVASNRITFDLPDDGNLHDFFDEDIISINTIKNGILERSKAFLSEYLELLRVKKSELVLDFVATKNPTLRAVVKYCPEALDEIELNTSDEKLYETLSKFKGKAELAIRKDTANLLKTQIKSFEEVKEKYPELEEKIEQFSKDQLAGCILYRKMIIDLLEKKLQLDPDGKYHNESIIHDIIFPRKTTTDEISFEDHNLWIIDENLTFHQFATSDPELKKISSSDSSKRPDIIILSEKDDDQVARAVSIIEFKKPQRPNFDKDPIGQMYDIIRDIKDKKVRLPTGRDLLINGSTRFYCYAICDINSEIRKYAENARFSQLKDDLGYYSYNEHLNAHTEILAFDKIIIDVKKRHKIFFEKLGI
jgi:hypothetical protein